MPGGSVGAHEFRTHCVFLAICGAGHRFTDRPGASGRLACYSFGLAPCVLQVRSPTGRGRADGICLAGRCLLSMPVIGLGLILPCR